MTFRHAVALAPVGWYLMVPPRDVDTFHPDAPLSQWHRFGKDEYASRDDCTAQRERLRVAFKEPADFPPERVTAKNIVREMAALECIATDDPRLKGKLAAKI